LGAFSYAAPLVSTLLLVAFGRAEPSWVIIALACIFIVGGAVLSVGDFLK
jgi:hypothetical protein